MNRKMWNYISGGPLYGIANGSGGFWSHRTFSTVKEADAYMREYWGEAGAPSQHEIIPVYLIIEDART